MNMISTGAFLTEMDASDKHETLAEKFAAVWEKKNSKAARAGGVSLMALSLAACGSSSTTTTTTDTSDTSDTVDTDPVDTTPVSTVGETIALAAASTTETVVGSTKDDTITASAANYEDTDRIIDPSGDDSDTLEITESATVTPDVTNIEAITINLNALGAANVDASKITGADTLTVNRGDVTVGGSTLTGNKAIVVDNVSSAGVGEIIIGAGATTVDINSAATDKAGVVVSADAAKTSVAVDGAATINAAIATGTVSVDAVTNTTADETAKATTINAAAAATVTTHADLTGSVTINAAKASTITVNDAQGGATVSGGTTSTADTTITVVDIDASGATITTGTGSSKAAEKQITVTLDGTAKTTDTASVSGTGVIALDLDGTSANTVDIVTLSGADGDVTYNVAANAETITSITKAAAASGAATHAVTVAGNESLFSAVTITNIDTLDLDAGTAGTIDGSKWTGVGTVDLGFNNSGNAITVSEGAHYEITTNQSGLDFDYTTGASSMSITAGDVNGATDTTVGTLTVGALDAAAAATAATTVVLTAEAANLTATSVTLGAKQVLEVRGDENVSLGTVIAKDVNAGSSTGNITLTAATGLSGTATTGSGDDNLTANGNDVHTMVAGAGDDTFTLTSTAATSSFDGGDGDDSFTVTDTDGYAVVGGAGDDSFSVGVDAEASIVGGEGSDTLTITAGGINFSDNTTFAMAAIEKLNLTATNGTTTFSAAQLANNPTMVITATGGDDILTIANPTTGGTLDASGLTTATGSALSALNLTGSAKADTITGGVLTETFVQTVKDDTITGGEKAGDADKLTAITTADTGTGVASVINMSGTEITSTDILAKTGYRTAGDAAAAAGTMQTLFNDTTATNDAAVTTFSEIESVVGTGDKDYIKGSSGADTIEGGLGDDYIHAGDGDDTVVVENTDTNVNGGGGTDTVSVAADTDFSGDTFAGFEKFLATGDGADLTIDYADLAAFTHVTGYTAAGSNLELLKTTTTTAVTVDLTGITYSNAGVSITTSGAVANTIKSGAGNDTMVLGGTGIQTVEFQDTNGTDTITGFAIGTDLVDFTQLTVNGTLAELAITNDAGTALGATTLSAANTTVYVIDTDATELGSATGAAIADFTAMADIAAFLNSDDGVVASGTANKVDYFSINDVDTNLNYVYKFVDDGDSTTTIEATELSLIASIDVGSTATLTTTETVVA